MAIAHFVGKTAHAFPECALACVAIPDIRPMLRPPAGRPADWIVDNVAMSAIFIADIGAMRVGGAAITIEPMCEPLLSAQDMADEFWTSRHYFTPSLQLHNLGGLRVYVNGNVYLAATWRRRRAFFVTQYDKTLLVLVGGQLLAAKGIRVAVNITHRWAAVVLTGATFASFRKINAISATHGARRHRAARIVRRA